MKRVILAFDSFKESLSAAEACSAAQKAVLEKFPNCDISEFPIGDGGEGTVDAYFKTVGGTMRETKVTGPRFNPVLAKYLILPDNTAVIEMAQSSGLMLMGSKKDGGNATTMGVGELIRDAVSQGCRDFIIGLGGSATNDGGAGALQALGYKLLNEQNKPITPTGFGLADIASIDCSDSLPELAECSFTIACDVKNRLCGEDGATRTYGRQKGITGDDFEVLDGNLLHFAEIIENTVGVDVTSVEGGGAAGGLCAGLCAFLNSRIVSGIELLLDKSGFDQKAIGADLIICGEGRIDSQSVNGKALFGIGQHAKRMNIPVIAICGELSDGYEAILDYGVTAAFSCTHYAKPFEEIKHRTQKDIYDVLKNLFEVMTL